MKLPTIYTIGHSTRPIGVFLDLLQAQGIKLLADVRTIPRSRHNPQYGSDSLTATLESHGIAYVHMPELGGLRHARKDSINTAWENASFRGFADYMQTPEFEAGLEKLIALAGRRTTVILCAEAVPWRCHRSLIADALLARGITVMDIMGKDSLREHSLTPWAEVEGTKVTYPGQTSAAAVGVRRRQKKTTAK